MTKPLMRRTLDIKQPTLIRRLFKWRGAVAESTKAEKDKSTLLEKRIDVPVKGRLARTVRAPRFLRSIGGYFAGAWAELRAVHWPNRRTTWGLTLAVIGFTIVLAIFILALDAGFEQLFKRIIL